MSNRVVCGGNAEQTKKDFIMNAELNIFGILNIRNTLEGYLYIYTFNT